TLSQHNAQTIFAAAVLVPALRGGGRRATDVPRPAVTVPTAPAAPIAAPLAPLPPPRAAIPDTITVEIETEPDGARVARARDHAPLGTTPIKLTWARGDGTEPLEVERDGYRSERVAVPLERGLTAKLHLEKVARAQRPAGAPRHPKSAAPAKAHPEPLKI
ncbi:MAG: PEGA domain-containing protein, partial [Polyangia bacterium]